jgi:surfactin family lipopeptide synthetase A
MTKQVELSYHQESWLRHISEDISGYNIPGVALVSGTLNKKKLQSSVNKVISNTDIMRSYFVKNDQQFECHIKDKIDYCIEHIDASKFSDEQVSSEILELQHHKFNLEEPPLFKIKILTINESKHLFCGSCHHLINDAIGATIFARNIVAAYYDINRDYEGEISYQFSDFLKEQQLYLDGQLYQRKNFWKKIHDFEPLTIRESPHKAAQNSISDMVSTKISIEKLQPTREIRSNLVTTQFILGFILTGKSNTYIATPITERITKQQRNCIGFASGPMMIAMRITNNITIHQIKTNLNRELEENICNYLPQSLIDREGYHKVSINLFDKNFLADIQPWVDITYQYMQANSMGLDIFIQCFKSDNVVEMQIHYDTDLYSNEFMQDYISNFSKILNILNSNSLNGNNLIQLQHKLEINTHEVT